jgi:type VI secretion system Hcp family effector
MKSRLFCMALVLFVTAVPLLAQMTFYLRVQGIEGEATEAQHINWIDAESMSYQLQSGGGLVNHYGLTVTKSLDKATPLLMMAACSTTAISEVRVQATREINGTQKVVYDVLLDNAKIRAITSVIFTNNINSYENITFGYEQIEWTYNLYDGAGNLTGSTTGNATVTP